MVAKDTNTRNQPSSKLLLRLTTICCNESGLCVTHMEKETDFASIMNECSLIKEVDLIRDIGIT